LAAAQNTRLPGHKPAESAPLRLLDREKQTMLRRQMQILTSCRRSLSGKLDLINGD